MEDWQASGGDEFFRNSTNIMNPNGARGGRLAERLKKEKKDYRQMRGTNGTPFKAGFDTLTAGNQIPAASTGRRGSHLSTKPIPVPPPRKVPYENTQAGPSEPRPEARFIAGSRKKLNLNRSEAKASEDDWVIQGDPEPDGRRDGSHQIMDAGPSNRQQSPPFTRAELHRTDGGHHPPPIYTQSAGRGRTTASKSRSISPTKKNWSHRRPSNADAPYEEEESIEDPNAFPEDDIVYVEQPGHRPTKANHPPKTFTSGVAEGTRSGAARRPTGSASPTRATTGHVDTKGKGKAPANHIFAKPAPELGSRTTRQSTGSESPVKPISEAGYSESKGKGKSPDRGYIEIDDEHHASDGQDYGRHTLPARPTKRSVIPTSGISSNVLMCCETQVVWCVDMMGEKRRIRVRQVELHSDGIVLGDSKERRSNLYIALSNISGTESCERSACPFIILNVKTKLSKTKIDFDRLNSLLIPGITGNSGRAPTEDEISTLRFFIHLESGASSEEFVEGHRQLTEFLTYNVKFRLRRQECEAHRAAGPRPIRDDPEAPVAVKQSLPMAAKKLDHGRTLNVNQDSALPRQRVRPTVELPSRNPAAKQLANTREKGKERELDPPKAKQSRMAKVVKTIFDIMPSRQSNRLSGAKPSGSEAEDLCSEDEVIPEPPKTPALAPPPDRGTVLFPYPLTGRASLTITKGELWRVMSGEFLNDTLIEWGLQLLLSDLKGPNSESDIHLFNSFFYTKISSKDRDKKLQPKTELSEARWPAYETIRKWTKSVDVFSKKFIIVPINEEYHWYLAVIYNPGLMLIQPPPDTIPTSTEKVETSPGTNITPDANDENDVDAELGSAREESNSDAPNSIMAVPDSDERMDVDVPQVTDVADESVDELDCIDRSPPVTKMKEKMRDLDIGPGVARPRIRRPPPPGRPISDPTLDAFRSQHENQASSSRTEPPTKPGPVKPVPVKAERPPDHVILDSQKPWIITFDSLGSPHRAVGNNLAQWLQWEARSKKGGEYDHVQIEYTHAQVPLQSNFSDCGLFLVHYARQLLTNPDAILRFVQRRLPRKDSDERKHFDAEIDTIWGISRDHNLRDEWQAKINSLKEQYETLKVENPTEDNSDPKAPEDDNAVAEGDSGEGFLEVLNPGNGVEANLPVSENVAVQEDDRMEQSGDQIGAEKSTEILDNTATAEQQKLPPSIADRPLDSEQVNQIASDGHSTMAERTEVYHDELDSDDDEPPRASPPPSGTIGEARPLVEAESEGRVGSPTRVEDDVEVDAISSVLTESTVSDGTGPESVGEADRYDAVDPQLSGYALAPIRPTTNLEDEGTQFEHDERYADPPFDDHGDSRNPISAQASVESLRMIKNAGPFHPTNPGPSGKSISRQAPGQSAEEAIDVNSDNEDNADTAPNPSHIHTGAEVEVPVSATPTSARSSTLFRGLTPSGASVRKTAVESRQPGSSPLTSLATSRGEPDMVPPSVRADSTSSKHSAIKPSVPSSPLTSTPSYARSPEPVHLSSRIETASGSRPAKTAPPAAIPSQAPWQAGQVKGDSLAALGGRKTPVSGLARFADVESNSSAENTPDRPATPVYPSMMKGAGSGIRRLDDDQSDPMPVAMARSNSGGLDALNDPEPTSQLKRHMSLDRKRGSREISSQSGTPGPRPDSNGPSMEHDVAIHERLNKPDTFTSSQTSPAKRAKTLDTRNTNRQNRKRPPNIITTDQDMEIDNVELHGEATSLPEHASSRQLGKSNDTGTSSSVSAPTSRLQPRSSTSEIVLTEEDGRPIILDTPDERYEADPWAQNLLERADDAVPSTSTSAIPYKRKTRSNQSTAMPLEEDYQLLDNNGKPDDLESRSDEDVAPKSVRRSSRHNTTSPQAPQGTNLAASSSSGDIVPIQNELDDIGLSKRQSLPQSAISKPSARLVTYSNKGKKRQQDPQKPNSAGHQSKLPWGSPALPTDSDAGPSTATRKSSANQKRQNDSPDSTTAAKKKKSAQGAPGHTPAKLKRGGAAPRKSKSKESGRGNDPIDIPDSD